LFYNNFENLNSLKFLILFSILSSKYIYFNILKYIK